MKESFRQSMASLHTWTGLLPGWVCFAIFLFGTSVFFLSEISQWMRPELRSAPVSSQARDAAEAWLERNGAQAESWNLSLSGSRNGNGFTVAWIPRGGEWSQRQEVTLDPETGRELAMRDTQGGVFLYAFHFQLHYLPRSSGRLLIWVASLAMLVTIVAGVITHKKIFADFFLLRFGKGQRSWLDAHNATAVLALPFHVMITYTGLVTLLFTLTPWAISANFQNEDAFREAANPSAPTITARGETAPMLPLRRLVAIAESEWHGAQAGYIAINHPGDAASFVDLYPQDAGLGAHVQMVRLSATTGDVLWRKPHPGPAMATQRVMIDLHASRFAGPVLRWLYFLSGVGGTVMIASGLVLWTVKRRAKLPDPARPHFGFRLVERLNIGVMAGAPAGIAAYFLANRLLSLGLAHRADWEINALFIAWGGVFVWTLARPAKRAWVEALAACAALYALVPVVNAATTTRGLVPSLIAHDWLFVVFDLVMLVMAAACAFTAWKVAHHTPKPAPRRQPRERTEATA